MLDGMRCNSEKALLGQLLRFLILQIILSCTSNEELSVSKPVDKVCALIIMHLGVSKMDCTSSKSVSRKVLPKE